MSVSKNARVRRNIQFFIVEIQPKLNTQEDSTILALF